MAEYVIALVDDEEEVRGLLDTFLTGEGYQTVGAANSASIFALIEKQTFDAFLIDVQIGREDGIELCRRIRKLEAYKLTPILCMTGLESSEIIHKAFDAGVDDFIPKPINFESLRARLRVQIQRTDYFGKLERARQMLKRYLSPRVATIAEEYSETRKIPTPVERPVSICFTDIRDFTALSETMDPIKLFSMLSAHLRDQIELVYRHGGYVDKFNGDGLMAMFDGGTMVEQSCLCALEIMELTSEKNPAKDKFPIGIGIHTGRVMIGNIGSLEHLDYSAVGTSVNLAARLCGYALPEMIIVSDSVRKAIGQNSRLRFLDRRKVKIRGVNDPVTIHRLVGKNSVREKEAVNTPPRIVPARKASR